MNFTTQEATEMKYEIRKTSELKTGDVVNCHGMRCLIDGEMTVSTNHPVARDGSRCRYYRALVLNRHDVPVDAVPFGWTNEGDGTHRWTIQGNDLAVWAVEVTPAPLAALREAVAAKIEAGEEPIVEIPAPVDPLTAALDEAVARMAPATSAAAAGPAAAVDAYIDLLDEVTDEYARGVLGYGLGTAEYENFALLLDAKIEALTGFNVEHYVH
jgi:hypothetical protein